MKRRTFIKATGAAGLITFISPDSMVHASNQELASQLEEKFRNPALGAYPQTYWFWMNGNVTREGITLDLEAMKRVGVGGVFNFDVGTGIPKGPVIYLSEEWLQLKQHAIREAERLGMQFTMHNCPGWSASGGPWITPDLAMQQITWSETYVSGGRLLNITLPKPSIRLGYYQQLAILAFPSLEGEDLLQRVKATSSSGPVINNQLTGENKEGIVVLPEAAGRPAWLQFEFPGQYEATLITFFISGVNDKIADATQLEFGERTFIELEASDDGETFRLVTRINTGLETELALGYKFITYDIPLTRAKYYRLTSSKARRYQQVQFSGITRLKNWMEKTNHRARHIMFVDDASSILVNNTQNVPAGSIIDFASILNITAFANEDGKLEWNAPPGNWTIMRIGFTPTGTLNRAAPDTGIGLECDKFSKQAMSFHFNKMMEQLLPFIKSLAAKNAMGLEIDSYEAGTQNWTVEFEKLFMERWGYDVIKYLPVVAGGRIINSVNLTERFLWDLRRLQADLMAEHYYGHFHTLCKAHNITSYIEPYELGPMEEMQIGSKVDVNMGEFWNGFSSLTPFKHPVLRTPKLAASIAHINGQQLVGAEAFTGEPEASRWQEYPFAMKAVGDRAFIKGINRLIFHRFAHQPHPTAKPGMTMGPWGVHFDRTNTWWNQSTGWLQYLSRCQSLLQQGRFFADLVYFTGEDANMYTKVNREDLSPIPPEGYDYDLINAEVVFRHASIVNNTVRLSTGMTYQVFVLQNYKAVTLGFLRKLRQLVNDGMVMVGSRPERSAGLADYADGDAEFRNIVKELWGDIDGGAVTEHRYGKGRIFWGPPLRSVLETLDLKPDFQLSSRSGDAPIIYIHRKVDDADVYFLSNQRRTYEDVVAVFRVKNKRPEIWDPATGKITPAIIYESGSDQVKTPLHFEPYGSVFVVFRSAASKLPFVELRRDNITVISTRSFSALPAERSAQVSNSFTVFFWAKPEVNVLLNPVLLMASIIEPWTEYFTIYPVSGKKLYGDGHATCGLAVGRNGIAVWEHGSGNPTLVLAVPVSISGWSAVALIYENGVPRIYVNGKLLKEGDKSKHIVHPASAPALLSEGASYYNGDMSEPSVYSEVLSLSRIDELSTKNPGLQRPPLNVEFVAAGKPTLLVKQNGRYALHNSRGVTKSFTVSGLDPAYEIRGAWKLTFPSGLGAPGELVLPELISLHKHEQDGVKFFSGTVTYRNQFRIKREKLTAPKRFVLDLGGVEVIARVTLNGKDIGLLWKRPYNLDITSTVKAGMNNLQIEVTNQWPNRLIGDEYLADPDEFTPGGKSNLESITSGAIQKLPDWYVAGRPKPDNGRVSFTTWKHYTRASPLLESGLIGPVSIQTALMVPIT